MVEEPEGPIRRKDSDLGGAARNPLPQAATGSEGGGGSENRQWPWNRSGWRRWNERGNGIELVSICEIGLNTRGTNGVNKVNEVTGDILLTQLECKEPVIGARLGTVFCLKECRQAFAAPPRHFADWEIGEFASIVVVVSSKR